MSRVVIQGSGAGYQGSEYSAQLPAILVPGSDTVAIRFRFRLPVTATRLRQVPIPDSRFLIPESLHRLRHPLGGHRLRIIGRDGREPALFLEEVSLLRQRLRRCATRAAAKPLGR